MFIEVDEKDIGKAFINVDAIASIRPQEDRDGFVRAVIRFVGGGEITTSGHFGVVFDQLKELKLLPPSPGGLSSQPLRL